jgi:hypothetical protein
MSKRELVVVVSGMVFESKAQYLNVSLAKE